jgi:SSS family solute:Na+ symporter
MDIYVKKFRPDADQKQIIKTGRIVTVLGAIIAVFMAVGIDSIKGLNLFDVFQAILGFLAPPLSVVFLFGVLWKKTTTRAANFTLIAGTIISMGTGIFYLFIFPQEKYDFWPHFLLLSFFIFVLLAIFAFLISYFDSNNEKQEAMDYGKLTKPDKQVKLLWIALVVVMIVLYFLFNMVI